LLINHEEHEGHEEKNASQSLADKQGWYRRATPFSAGELQRAIAGGNDQRSQRQYFARPAATAAGRG
jgi:hypothetical protein